MPRGTFATAGSTQIPKLGEEAIVVSVLPMLYLNGAFVLCHNTKAHTATLAICF
jgi:hypothetical protein